MMSFVLRDCENNNPIKQNSHRMTIWIHSPCWLSNRFRGLGESLGLSCGLGPGVGYGWSKQFIIVYLHLEMYGEAQGSKGFHIVSVQHPDVFQSKDVSQRRTSPGLAQVQIPSSHRSRIPVNGNVEWKESTIYNHGMWMSFRFAEMTFLIEGVMILLMSDQDAILDNF